MPKIISKFFNLFILLINLEIILNEAAIAEPFASNCPESCVCSSITMSIVCSCQNDDDFNWAQTKLPGHGRIAPTTSKISTNNHLILDGLRGDQLSKCQHFIVHSCDNLIIKNDTFVGMEIIHRLQFVGIGHLEFDSYAFRGLLQSPKQLVVQDSHVEYIAPHAFTGISNVDHFWWRNVTIRRIAKMSFAKIYKINYFYFRHSNIDVLEPGAFAHMYSIEHFYMRESVRIGTASDHLFVGSNFDEIIFENAAIHATDLTLVGIQARRFQILNCRLHFQKRPLRRIPQQNIRNFHIQNSTLNRCVISLLYNISSILIESTQLHHLHSEPHFSAFNIGEIRFQYSIVTHWHSHVFDSARNIGALIFENSRLHHIHRYAIHNAHILLLRFDKSHIKAIGENAFSGSHFGTVEFVDCEFGKLGSALFYEAQIVTQLILHRLRVHSSDSRVFAGINIGQIEIANSTFTNFLEKAFEKSNISSVWIHDSVFGGYFNSTWFSELSASHLRVSKCQFGCLPNACENNALLLRASIHNIAWMFTNNRCVNEGLTIDEKENNSLIDEKGSFERTYQIEEAEEICSDEVQTFNRSGLICRRRIFVEECICLARAAGNLPTAVRVPATLAHTLVLGDCRKVILEASTDNLRPNLQFIYLYRVDSLHVIELDPTLRQLHVLFSNVHLNYANAFALPENLDEVRFSGSLLHNIGSESFASSHINLLLFNATTLRNIAANAFTSSSKIQRLELWDSDVLEFAGDLLDGAATVRIENSYLPLTRPEKNECRDGKNPPKICQNLKPSKDSSDINAISKRCAKLLNIEKDCLPYQLVDKSNSPKLELLLTPLFYYIFSIFIALITISFNSNIL